MRKFLVLGTTLMLLSADTTSIACKTAMQNGYELVFCDEFNQSDGTKPEEKFWSCSPRGTSMWDRWISTSEKVAFVRGGKLICRAIRNVGNPADTASMLTGAVETRHKFSFQYGKIEVRARTKSHSGNFPAIWLMPQPPADRHPMGGEIDIFESFGKAREARHAVHTHWTYNLKHTTPANIFIKKLNVDRWHVYGLEWNKHSLVFYIDGKVSAIYNKSSDKDALDNQQWPFDHPFYIILNQSVRMPGSPLGGSPDFNYVYETQYDWIRVYQESSAK